MPKLCSDYLQIMQSLCNSYAAYAYYVHLCLNYVQFMHKVCTVYAQIMHRLCTGYAQVMHKLYTDFANNAVRKTQCIYAKIMQKLCTDYAKIMQGFGKVKLCISYASYA